MTGLYALAVVGGVAGGVFVGVAILVIGAYFLL